MKTEGNEPINPSKHTEIRRFGHPMASQVMSEAIEVETHGLTKREYFAAMAMQGLLSNDSLQPDHLAKLSVAQADALIYALNQKTK